MRPELVFILPRGLDSIPVAAEPYETLVGRCWSALAQTEGVEVVRMSHETQCNAKIWGLIDFDYRHDRKLMECFTFLGRKIEIEG